MIFRSPSGMVAVRLQAEAIVGGLFGYHGKPGDWLLIRSDGQLAVATDGEFREAYDIDQVTGTLRAKC